ncbi:MAG: Chromate resistance protein ChrB [Clostridiaceae bacterium]
MERTKWLVLNYNLPSEPSRHRVAVWRGLKKLGAVNIQQSMWILPKNEQNYKSLMKISNDIETNSGESLIMESVFIDDNHEKRIESLFNKMRDEEYIEFIVECKRYLKEMGREIKNEKFTFAELEDQESELEKLIAWYEKIKARDLFRSNLGEEARLMDEQIRIAFENFSLTVYNLQIGD